MTLKSFFFNMILVLAMGMFFPSCYFDKEDTLYPFQKCDTTNVTYSQTIVPILNANCYICHYTGSQESNIALDTWAGVKVMADNGKLLPSINHTGPFPMPKNGSMLDICSIDKIQTWVKHGAPNN